MATQNEAPQWDDVYQLETTDEVLGGLGGVANQPLRELTRRTSWIRRELVHLQLSNWGKSTVRADDYEVNAGCTLFQGIGGGDQVWFGMMVGTKIAAGPTFDGPLLCTTYDGVTWFEPSLPVSDGRIRGCCATPSFSYGYAVGHASDHYVLRSVDQGSTWTSVHTGTGELYAIAADDDQQWVAVGKSGRVVRRLGGGAIATIFIGSDDWVSAAYDNVNQRFIIGNAAGAIATIDGADLGTDTWDVTTYSGAGAVTSIVCAAGKVYAAAGDRLYFGTEVDDLALDTLAGEVTALTFVPFYGMLVGIDPTTIASVVTLTPVVQDTGETTWAERRIRTMPFANIDEYPPGLKALMRDGFTGALVAVGNVVSLRSLQLLSAF